MLTSERETHNVAGVTNLSGGADAAQYMEEHLSGPVRVSIEAVLRDQPQNPLRYMAQTLQAQKQSQSNGAFTNPPSQAMQRNLKEVVDALQANIQRKPSHETPHDALPAIAPPLSVTVGSGTTYHVHPLPVDFARAGAKHSAAAPPPSFPSVLYREAASLFEVGSCLRRLQQLNPQAPLLLFVEAPAPTSNIFFYEGLPYACTAAHNAPIAEAQEFVTDEVRTALSAHGGTVWDFSEALRSTATEAGSTVRLTFLPSLQTNFLAALDQLSSTLDETFSESWSRAQVGGEQGLPRAAALLPSVLLVSYRPETARLTHTRLLAAYGPFYEVAQRMALQTLRLSQLERKRKFTFSFAMEYWAQVQRRRETSNNTAANAGKASTTALADTNGLRRENEEASASAGIDAAAAGEQESTPDDAACLSAVQDVVKSKRVAPRSVKRALPTYDADQQAEDDVFLVVIRRLEHAAATLIQSVYRGHRARVRCQQMRRTLATSSIRPEETSVKSVMPRSVTHGFELFPPLLQASLMRLHEEGEAFGHIWEQLPTSPAPDSRRCWIYRPVQRTVKASPAGQEGAAGVPNTKESVKGDAARMREDWVQEELLIPPVRATEPRARINLAQRLLDYLDVAQCTILHDTVQLLADSPGMSVLQRRAYDHVKSICLTLFFVAYGELRQRDRGSVPCTFSQYMSTHHASVLTWFQFPHESSLLLRAVADGGGGCCAGDDAAKRAAGVFVQAKLSAHEYFLVAHNSQRTATSVAASGDGGRDSDALVLLSTHLLLSPQPLLSTAEWAKEVSALAAAAKDGSRSSTDVPKVSVEWWSLAAVPMCCVTEVPVAAVGRWDAQLLDGAPAYDCFVPRVRKVAASVALEEVRDTTQADVAIVKGGEGVPSGSCAARVVDMPAAAMVVRAWVRGQLADAEDAALAKHVQAVLANDGYVEGYRAVRNGSASFIDLPHKAALARCIAVQGTKDALQHTSSPGEESLRLDGENSVQQAGDSPSARRRSHERRGGWERVMEAVALEAAASRRNSPRHSTISLSPRASVSAGGWSRHQSLHPSPSAAASLSFTDSHEEANMIDEKAATLRRGENEAQGPAPSTTRKDMRAVLTVSEAAKEVAAATTAVALHHKRRALRFVPRWEGAVQMEEFLCSVAASLRRDADTSSCLVLALDVASQAFFALVAVLVEHRLQNTREATLYGASAATFNTESALSIDADEHLSFLSGFHEVLANALADASVQLAATHVLRVLTSASATASPQLNLLLRLKQAIQQAEEASSADVQSAVLSAVQLAEQYTWLVQLEWYLWSPHFAISDSGHAAPAEAPHGFADSWMTTSAARQWVEQMDPWAAAPARSPDPGHLRYSNGLRRWEDKHYVCFGAL